MNYTQPMHNVEKHTKLSTILLTLEHTAKNWNPHNVKM